jgi:hypothetical protein
MTRQIGGKVADIDGDLKTLRTMK